MRPLVVIALFLAGMAGHALLQAYQPAVTVSVAGGTVVSLPGTSPTASPAPAPSDPPTAAPTVGPSATPVPPTYDPLGCLVQGRSWRCPPDVQPPPSRQACYAMDPAGTANLRATASAAGNPNAGAAVAYVYAPNGWECPQLP